MSEGFGAFGKMPALGDFFQLNAPPGFVRVWDDWVQGAMTLAGEAAGEAWDDKYMSAPIWRFTLSSGLAGPAKTIGVLMPSVDRVGRRFPLSLMASVEGDRPAAQNHLRHDSTFEQLEDLALSTLEDGMDRDRLAGALADINVPTLSDGANVIRKGGALIMACAEEKGTAPELAAALLNAEGFAAPSFWTAVLSGSSSTMICDGLPRAAQLSALFDLSAPFWAEARPAI